MLIFGGVINLTYLSWRRGGVIILSWNTLSFPLFWVVHSPKTSKIRTFCFFLCVYPLCSWTVTSTNTGTSEETNMLEGFCICKQKMQAKIIGLLRGGVQGEGFPEYSLMFPKVSQSSQTESLGFPRNTPSPWTPRDP